MSKAGEMQAEKLRQRRYKDAAKTYIEGISDTRRLMQIYTISRNMFEHERMEKAK